MKEVDGRSRFSFTGPVVTITLKDPHPQQPFIRYGTTPTTTAAGADNGSSNKDSLVSESSSDTVDDSDEDEVDGNVNPESSRRWGWRTPWVDFSSLQPSCVFSVQSEGGRPLPNWLPSLKFVKATATYQHHNSNNDLQQLKHKRLFPSLLGAVAKFSHPAGDLHVQPTYQVSTGLKSLTLQASRGASYLVARFGSRTRYLLNSVRASAVFHLPFATVSTVRVTPTLDVTRKDLSCTLESASSGLARTKAILRLERENPTLSVIHNLDERNTIAPEICLYNAKIVYQWNRLLGDGTGGSQVCTTVDPARDISVQWIDQSAAGGTWVTDLRFPLEGVTIQTLAADIRVRRQFCF